MTLDYFTGNFRIDLDQRAQKPVNVVQVIVGPTGFVGAPEQAVVDIIRSMYANRPAPDLIMTIGGPAALFARKYRQQLFPSAPLIFAALDEQYLRGTPLHENETAIAVANDMPRLVDDILRVLPETRQIFMVTGSGVIGRLRRPELEQGFARFKGRVTFVWSDSMSFADILHSVRRLQPRSAIIFQTFGTDVQGGAYPADQVIATLYDSANAPLFAMQSPYLGHGIVGGSMMNIDELARRTADIVDRVLKGEPTASFRVPPQSMGRPIYDWRQLRRWDIPESRLPPGSVVRYRAPSLWEEHKNTVLTAAGALILQSFLIALLLLERRARQRAEEESRQNLALAADANRRETISALTSSIGHELGQPLSAIMHNAQTLQMLATSNRAEPQATEEIATDIKAEAALAGQIIERHRTMLRSHRLQKTPVDVRKVIEESLALLAHDMDARNIAVTSELPSTACVVDGDQVLLEQVVINLVRNAMDAVGEMPPAQRYITIRIAVTASHVEISVSDTGPGLPADIVGTLFTAFVTTKSHGLGIGLTIAQRIVEAHSGKITVRENADGGATFIVTLPCSAPLRYTENNRAAQVHPERAVSADGE